MLKISLQSVFQVLRKQYPSAKFIVYNHENEENCLIIRAKKGKARGMGYYDLEKLEFNTKSENWTDLFADAFINGYSKMKRRESLRQVHPDDLDEEDWKELYGNKENHEDLFSEQKYLLEKGMIDDPEATVRNVGM